MSEHKYWTHLIKLQANQTPGAKYWEGKAQVQYNDGRAFRFFEVHGPAEEFTSKEEARAACSPTSQDVDRQVYLRNTAD